MLSLKEFLQKINFIWSIIGTIVGILSVPTGLIVFFVLWTHKLYLFTLIFERTHAAEFAAVFSGMTIVLSIILIFYIQRYKRTKYKLREMSSLVDRYRSCENHFRAMHSTNAECDVKLFDYLFYHRSEGTLEQHGQLTSALSEIDKDINMSLDTIAYLLSDFSKTPCTSTLWLFESISTPNSRNSNSVFLVNKRQNTASKSNRINGVKSRISLEDHPTIYEILDNNEEIIYAQVSAKGGKNKNILLCGIPTLEGEGVLTKAALSVESDSNSLDDATCRHYLVEMSYRLGVMLYRQNRIGNRLAVPATVEVTKGISHG